MNFDKFNEIIKTRKNYGELENADLVSEFENDACGDNYVLYMRIEDDVIQDIRYTTNGCSFSIVSLEILCDLLRGKKIQEIESITATQMEEPIEGYPERRRNYIETAFAAARKAKADYERSQNAA